MKLTQSQSAEAIAVAFSAGAIRQQNIAFIGFVDGGIAKATALIIFQCFGKQNVFGFLIKYGKIQLFSSACPYTVYNIRHAGILWDRIPYHQNTVFGYFFGAKRRGGTCEA